MAFNLGSNQWNVPNEKGLSPAQRQNVRSKLLSLKVEFLQGTLATTVTPYHPFKSVENPQREGVNRAWTRDEKSLQYRQKNEFPWNHILLLLPIFFQPNNNLEHKQSGSKRIWLYMGGRDIVLLPLGLVWMLRQCRVSIRKPELLRLIYNVHGLTFSIMVSTL